ncbi:hypothetical protein F5972_30340 [Microbispora cellulosiformans]|uniref:Beta-mannosidase n=2 Tax=Microbispora cellulosiformans TaxID=2614688 RepID=A0A5J5JTP5_9ACTN|nr:hypothetical protein F5972_30340 [Microbispora cellulosiformans]
MGDLSRARPAEPAPRARTGSEAEAVKLGRTAAMIGVVAAMCLTTVQASGAVGTGTASAAAAVCARPPQTANDQASAGAVAVHRYLYSLTCDTAPADGVISGQNVGHGPQAADTTGLLGYPRLIDRLAQQAGHYTGMAGLDYEHDQIFTPQQLSLANQVLAGHAGRGGLVTVNFSPQSPWLNDESDIAGNPGVWTNTRTDNGQLDGVRLADLLDQNTPAGRVWQRKLARVADALTQLRDAGVVVLWRPMQEMNGFWFWWGTTLQKDGATVYVQLWRSMFQYFTQVRHLDNLLWVYSPATYPADPGQQTAQNIRSAAWAYPGDAYVDIVAGTSYDDNLSIPNYLDYLRIPKVVGEAEYGPGLSGAHVTAGSFDDRRYATRLRQDYPAVAYWVSWHDYTLSATETAHLSLIANQNAANLLSDPYVINVDRVAIPSGPSPSPSASPSRTPSPSPSPSPSAGAGECAAVYQTTGGWPGQFQGQVTVRNTGRAALNGWTVSWTFPGGATVAQVWNGDASPSSGSRVVVRNASYNGALAAGGSTTFGFIANGSGSGNTPGSVACTPS